MPSAKRRLVVLICLILSSCFLFASATPSAGERGAGGRDPFVARADSLVQDFVRRDFLHMVSMFDEQMKSALPQSSCAEIWNNLTGQFGNLKNYRFLRTVEVQEYRQVFFSLEFEKGSLVAKIVLDSTSRIAGLWFLPPEPEKVKKEESILSYVDPDKFSEVDTTFGTEGWELPATLSLPKGNGPFRAAVLVHGSGPQDRNESIGPNQPFREIAWGLATSRIAVFRYEKRTKHYGEKLKGATVRLEEEVISDALEAIAFLSRDRRINKNKIFVLGHSLGGMLACEIAERSGTAKGAILLAAPARPIEEVILSQFEYIYSLEDSLGEKESAQLAEIRRAAEEIKSGTIGKEEMFLGAPGRYWLEFKQHDPVKATLAFDGPLMILQGGRDYQSIEEDFRIWRGKLRGKSNVTFRFYSDLNHIFVKGTGTATPSEYLREGHVDGKVIRDIVSWIEAN